jgi:hypothetical protein
VAAALRCEECGCLSEEARDWIAHIVEDDEEPDADAYVVTYCPSVRCSSSIGLPEADTPDVSPDGGGQPPFRKHSGYVRLPSTQSSSGFTTQLTRPVR